MLYKRQTSRGRLEKESPRPVNSHLTYILTQYEVPHDRGQIPLSQYFFFCAYVSEMMQRYKFY